MEKTERCAESRPIDAGGVIQLLTGIKEQSPAFLIEYATREAIDRERLRAAVRKALDVFRAFQVKLALSGPDRKPAYEINAAEIDVYPYDGRPHAFGEESNGYLFRVYHAENRVLLSMPHVLTDFCGANEFLKCILCFYFDVLNGKPEDIRRRLALDPDDLRDPYALYGSADPPDLSMKRKWRNELEIPNRMLYRRGEPVRIHELVFSIADFLKTIKRAESSVFPLLAWLTGKAVSRTYGGEDRLLTGAGSVNCRNMFHSRTPKCFSQTIVTVLHPRERFMDLDLQLTIQRADAARLSRDAERCRSLGIFDGDGSVHLGIDWIPKRFHGKHFARENAPTAERRRGVGFVDQVDGPVFQVFQIDLKDLVIRGTDVICASHSISLQIQHGVGFCDGGGAHFGGQSGIEIAQQTKRHVFAVVESDDLMPLKNGDRVLRFDGVFRVRNERFRPVSCLEVIETSHPPVSS